ncbi:MAG TPA: alpha-E domain-containing protein [Verrucomicrobiae bacterium]|nr:alpha-E domain-containing protein [Verrucomicrobiae bacterium]
MPSLLARYAECIYWMARYVERAENLARILDVTQSSARRQGSAKDWAAILEINSDLDHFQSTGQTVSDDAIVMFYVLDADNETSILHALTSARENARTLRPFISTEMWSHLNVAYNWLRRLTPADLAPSERPRLLATIKEHCQTHTGITEGTFFRDQGWYFYQLGRYVERADQATRLLDVKFHNVPADSPTALIEAGEAAAILRSAAGYHAFRRVHPRGYFLEDVVGFLLLDGAFPRSVSHCIAETDQLLHELRQRYGLRGGNRALERLDEIRVALDERPPAGVLRAGLHEFVDWIQRQIIDINETLAADFFGNRVQLQQQAEAQ